jgi:hypothetical protein
MRLILGAISALLISCGGQPIVERSGSAVDDPAAQLSLSADGASCTLSCIYDDASGRAHWDNNGCPSGQGCNASDPSDSTACAGITDVGNTKAGTCVSF